MQFEERFNHKIAQLIYMFPEDAQTSNGSTFWSPPKRFPKVVPFEASDPSHAAYAQASAILFAEMYRIKVPEWARDAAEVAKRTAAVNVRFHTLCLVHAHAESLARSLAMLLQTSSLCRMTS